MSSKKNTRSSVTQGFVIGRARFEKISAIEGVKITSGMKKREAEFDKKGLSAEHRRRSIIDAHRIG
jgi:hypothetical protein